MVAVSRTAPAYLRDLFGPYHVSAIHGRLLTAWSVAGVLGPVLVNYLREYQLEHGADKASAYQTVLYLMAGLLIVGFIANLSVRPVAQKYWLVEHPAEPQAVDFGEREQRSSRLDQRSNEMASNIKTGTSSTTTIVFAWLLVGAPLGWGVFNTLLSSMALFQAH